MNRGLSTIGWFSAGTAVMYFLDPDRGRRRRALVRDKLARIRHRTNDALQATARDLRQRLRGAVAEARATVWRHPVDDIVLAERVRSKLGRLVTHPGAIEVSASNGRITLRGAVLASEEKALLAGVRAVHSVKDVASQLDVRQQPGDLPGLQGAGRRREARPAPLQEHWSPTTRVLAGGMGALVGAGGLAMGGPFGWFLAAAGGLLAARGATNLPLRRLLGLGGGRRAIDVRKDITIKAPVDEVFEFWSHSENFPRFMSHVKEVRDLGAGRSHWTVTGPAGTEWRWQAVVTRVEPNAILAWKSVAGAPVQHAGLIRFEANPDDSTTIRVRLSYNPPAGALGHVVATFFGSDPKSAIDDDLIRLKSLLEEGKATGSRGSVTLDDLTGGVPPESTLGRAA